MQRACRCVSATWSTNCNRQPAHAKQAVDFHATYASLSEAGDPLERLNAVIDREIFRPILSGIDSAERKRPAC